MSAARANRRSLLRDLRRLGCRCRPTITTFSHAELEVVGPAGATIGGFVRHDRGCPLGDVVFEANQRGELPSIVTTGSGCDR